LATRLRNAHLICNASLLVWWKLWLSRSLGYFSAENKKKSGKQQFWFS
jgi:hypothetical protein